MSRPDPFFEFRKLTLEQQRDEILRITALCIDGAPVTLARKIEIYMGETEQSTLERQRCVCGGFSWQHFDGREHYVPADAIRSHPYKHKDQS